MRGTIMNLHTEHLVVAKNFPSRAIAEAGQQFLKKHNIIAIVQGPEMAGMGAPLGCDLYVQQHDLAIALDLLERLYDSI
jgi:hypothetical protein